MEKTQQYKAVNRIFTICLFCLFSLRTNAQLAVHYNEPMSELYLVEKSENGIKYLDTTVFLNMNREYSFQLNAPNLFASYAVVTNVAHKTYVLESYLVAAGKMKLISQTFIHLNKYPVLKDNEMKVTLKDFGICLNFENDCVSMVVLPYLVLENKNKLTSTLKNVQHLYKGHRKKEVILK